MLARRRGRGRAVSAPADAIPSNARRSDGVPARLRSDPHRCRSSVRRPSFRHVTNDYAAAVNTDRTSSATRPDSSPARLIAASACGLEAVALAAACAFYLYELVSTPVADPARVAMSALLIAVFAVALGVLARAWLAGADWPRTPTIVWNVLLLPVAWSLHGGGRTLVAVSVAVVALAGLGAALASPHRD